MMAIRVVCRTRLKKITIGWADAQQIARFAPLTGVVISRLTAETFAESTATIPLETEKCERLIRAAAQQLHDTVVNCWRI